MNSHGGGGGEEVLDGFQHGGIEEYRVVASSIWEGMELIGDKFLTGFQQHQRLPLWLSSHSVGCPTTEGLAGRPNPGIDYASDPGPQTMPMPECWFSGQSVSKL